MAIDACGATVSEIVPLSTLNQCRTGIIERRFEARDNIGVATCSQYIHVVNENPFTFSDMKNLKILKQTKVAQS